MLNVLYLNVSPIKQNESIKAKEICGSVNNYPLKSLIFAHFSSALKRC
jgi:hypothetical protein